jgi:hypothetical protein
MDLRVDATLAGPKVWCMAKRTIQGMLALVGLLSSSLALASPVALCGEGDGRDDDGTSILCGEGDGKDDDGTSILCDEGDGKKDDDGTSILCGGDDGGGG